MGLAFSPLLAGCGGGDTLHEAFGYEQGGPDELAVIKRPPLIVPPDYNLRPPRPEDEAAGTDAASEAARRTLIGPSSSLGSDSNNARALLTGTSEQDEATNGAAPEVNASSDGQSLLVSRSDRTELNLDELTETRAENRVDTALLRRLLAWMPEDRLAATDTAGETGDEAAEVAVVRVVSRSQTVIDPESSQNP